MNAVNEVSQIHPGEMPSESQQSEASVKPIRYRKRPDPVPAEVTGPIWETFVYFVQEPISGAVKIGVAANVLDRLRRLQTSHPYELILLGTCPGGLRLEQALHRRFAKARLLGEWFKPWKGLFTKIEALRTLAPPTEGDGSWQPHVCERCGNRLTLPHGKAGTHTGCDGRYWPLSYLKAWTVSPGYPEPAAGQIPLVIPLVKTGEGV